ncbi:MAG: hypothetical protein QF613_00520 [Candidatus Marinimicrobia bacterium]|nr:hypothetical protein [Candidatus Neomarinimicrobiota bacterium]MDP6592685.1 hypothetical protein [Candidatus Neomarinimicrobiota bacterium]MDP6837252.1 hypothetical protein [Candidatus Neomarinimicrobiota bacterium]
MKRLSLLIVALLSLSTAQDRPLFNVDVRIRIVQDDLLYVVVQIDNNSGRTVTQLHGFLTESDPSANIVSEEKIVHLHKYEPMMTDGQTAVRGVTYPFNRAKDHRYRYHISYVKFRNDPRVFAYSPVEGLIRIE